MGFFKILSIRTFEDNSCSVLSQPAAAQTQRWLQDLPGQAGGWTSTLEVLHTPSICNAPDGLETLEPRRNLEMNSMWLMILSPDQFKLNLTLFIERTTSPPALREPRAWWDDLVAFSLSAPWRSGKVFKVYLGVSGQPLK